MTDENLAHVGEVYTEAAEAGISPVPVIAKQLGCSMRTAQRLASEARGLGYIDAEVAVRNRKAVLIARALGVSYEDLVSAVLNIADGDLRVSKGDSA